jgi:adenine deaminase
MTNKEKIHRLLTHALIEIRESSHSENHKVVFHIADLFHNVPNHLMMCVDEPQYDKVLKFVRARSVQKGIERWLDNALNDVAENAST